MKTIKYIFGFSLVLFILYCMGLQFLDYPTRGNEAASSIYGLLCELIGVSAWFILAVTTCYSLVFCIADDGSLVDHLRYIFTGKEFKNKEKK